MTTTVSGSDGVFEPDPQDWPATDPVDLSPEALENDPDDIVTEAPEEDRPIPVEADEADVLDQRTDSGLELDDEEPEEV